MNSCYLLQFLLYTSPYPTRIVYAILHPLLVIPKMRTKYRKITSPLLVLLTDYIKVMRTTKYFIEMHLYKYLPQRDWRLKRSFIASKQHDRQISLINWVDCWVSLILKIFKMERIKFTLIWLGYIVFVIYSLNSDRRRYGNENDMFYRW